MEDNQPLPPLTISQVPGTHSTQLENPFTNADGRPPDVRPKNPLAYRMLSEEKSLQDPTSNVLPVPDVPLSNSHSDNSQLNQQTTLKPNLSCPNW